MLKNLRKCNLLFKVQVHYKNGEKQTLALVETYRDYVIAPYFTSEEEGWKGSGTYLLKDNYTICQALSIYNSQLDHELESAFVDKITL